MTEAWERQEERAAQVAHLAALLLAELRSLAGAGKKRKSGRRQVSSRDAALSGTWKDGAEFLLPAIHEIVEHREPACRIKDLARRLGVSESHLRAEFRKRVGHSLGHYLKQIRISRAAALLAGTPLRVGEIAERSGFDSLYSFSRFFRKAMGVSPRAYRQSPGPEPLGKTGGGMR
jgi:AraC-like DNA-binding protein